MIDDQRCAYHAPAPDNAVRCNRESNHEGPHRGDVSDNEVIFWSWGRPRRALVRLTRETQFPERWLMVNPSRSLGKETYGKSELGPAAAADGVKDSPRDDEKGSSES